MRGCVALLALLAGCDEVFDLERIDEREPAITPDAALPANLVAWFPMEDVEREQLADLAGEHDGACMPGRCPTPVVGVVGGALAFDGATDAIVAPSSATLDAKASFTIAVWARIDAPPTTDDYGCVVNKLYATIGENSWQFCANTGRWYFYSVASQVTGPPVELGAWHHLAATWDAKATELRLYLDGGLYGQPVSFDIPFDNGRLVIGADIDAGMTIAWFPGAIDDVRIYNRVLSEVELTELTRLR